MLNSKRNIFDISNKNLMSFIAIALFYFFETAQMSYYNVLAPAYLGYGVYNHASIGAISAAYYYGDVAGLLPVGYALDRFPFRASLFFALIGSIFGAFMLFVSDSFTIQWISRFICGFCGGTFSFIAGIRIVTVIFKNRFSYGFSIFLSAGILGAMLCQFPLLIVVNHFGPKGAMFAMFTVGAAIGIFNYLYLHPPFKNTHKTENKKLNFTAWQVCKKIIFNLRNWSDVLMIVLLETPGTILGTLWGVVLITNFFHFNSEVSSLIITIMLLGSMFGLPILGHIADRYDNKSWIITTGAIICVFLILLMFFFSDSNNIFIIGLLFFALGFFYSCQTVGFHWITTNMKSELIGRNSAFNSMIFMSFNGGLKQLSAYFFTIPAIWMAKTGSSGNLLTIILISMICVSFYSIARKILFKKIRNSSSSR